MTRGKIRSQLLRLRSSLTIRLPSAHNLSKEETHLNAECPRSKLSRLSWGLLHAAAFMAVGARKPLGIAQRVQPDTILVKNWPVHAWGDPALGDRTVSLGSNTAGLVFIA